MRVLIVSEGEHELGDDSLEGALVTLVSRLLNLNENVSFERKKVSSPEVRQHTQQGKGGRYEKRALGWIRLAERDGYNAIILVIDQDGDEERKQQFDRAQDDLRLSLPRALGVAIKTFDAWMLADEQALSGVLETRIDSLPNPESESDPKGRCKELRDTAHSQLSLREMYAAIAERTNMERLKDRCPNGFAPFAQRVRSLAERRHPCSP